MSGFIAFRISALACLLVFLYSRQSSARGAVYRPTVANLPDDPYDPYYRRFQTVPTTEVTATQLMTKFLGINPTNTRRKRAASLYLSDVVIVMDGSSSIGRCEFEGGRAAMMNLILAASKKPGFDEKFAAVTFSNSASVNFKFLPYSAARQQLMMISYPGGGSNTQAGLEMAKTLFQDFSAGGRVSSRKKVLLFTNGQSTIQKQLTIPKANNLKNMGVEIYVVAVGSYNWAGIDEMVKVAGSSDPYMQPGDYLFRVHNYIGLWEVTKLVVQNMASTGKYASLSPYASPCWTKMLLS